MIELLHLEKRRNTLVTILYKILTSLLLLLVLTIIFDILIPAFLPPEYSSILEEKINITHILIYLAFFLSLNMVNHVLGRHPVTIPISMVSKLFLLLIILDALSFGKLYGSIAYNGYKISVFIDLSKPLYVTILLTLILGFIDVFKKLSSEEV